MSYTSAKNTLSHLLLIIIISQINAQQYSCLGEAGSGKSTLINALMGTNAPTGNFDSITLETTKYEGTTNVKPSFKGSTFFDTPGLWDTRGVSNSRIMEEIEGYYLRYANASNSDVVNGFIVVVGSTNNRVRLQELFIELTKSFSPSVLKSMVVVINHFESTPPEFLQELKDFIEDLAHQATNKHPTSQRIPVVIVNAKNPSDAQVSSLINALKKIEPYKLHDLEIKRQEIVKIYERMLGDSNNYKDVVEKVVVDKSTVVDKDVYIKVPQKMQQTKSDGCKVSIGVPGIFSICVPNKVVEDVIVLVDELRKVPETQIKQEVEEHVHQVLKNELQIYWILAVQEFEEKRRREMPRKTSSMNLDL